MLTRQFFLLLSLIIPRPNSVKSYNFDVYLAPLLEELHELWKGVPGIDVLQPTGGWHFMLRAILMWTIHDLPGYGIVSGCQHQGYRAYPPYGSRMVSRLSKKLGKPIFEWIRRWLQWNHPYKTHPNARHFDGREELQRRPHRTSVEEIMWQARRTEEWVRVGNVLGAIGCPSRKAGVKRLSTLFTLPYWQVGHLSISHSICMKYC